MEQQRFFTSRLRFLLIIVCIYFILLLSLQWLSILRYRLSTPPKGFYSSEFEAVARAFRRNFEKGLEREGAHLTIIRNGKVVMNLWNGYSDSDSYRQWDTSTRTVLFSITKAVAALCLAMQVDRGRLSYDEQVVKYWPEYGQYGKHITTIEDVLTHKAGLPYLENITMADVVSERMMRILEEAKPVWKPGTATGYHALTFGWLLDGIFRNVDEKGRDMKTFLREEIAHKYGIDVSIGLDKEKFHSLARMTQPGLLEFGRDLLIDPRMFFMLAIFGTLSDSIVAKIRTSWLPLNFDTVPLNDPNVAELNVVAMTGISDAYNLAKLFSLAIDGTLLSNQTLALLTQPTLENWHIERIILYPFVKGRGFFFEKHPINKRSYLFGHPGYGCQALDVDIENKIVVVYLSNGFKTGTGIMCATYQSILRSLYRT